MLTKAVLRFSKRAIYVPATSSMPLHDKSKLVREVLVHIAFASARAVIELALIRAAEGVEFCLTYEDIVVHRAQLHTARGHHAMHTGTCYPWTRSKIPVVFF